MINISTDAKLAIRQRSVTMPDRECREAIVSFEMFSYPSRNGGQECPVVVLSKAVRFASKNPENPLLHPDYERMVAQAAEALAVDFDRMTGTLKAIAAKA